MTSADRVLIVGVPRTGTTYLSRMLLTTKGAGLVSEPGNAGTIAGCVAGRGLGMYPALLPGDEAPGLERALARAFGPRRFSDRVRRRVAEEIGSMDLSERRILCFDPRPHRLPLRLRAALLLSAPAVGAGGDVHIVKTVHPLTTEWVMEKFPSTLVLTRRHPLDVLASWIELEFDPAEQGWAMFATRPIEDLAERLGAPPVPDRSLDGRSPTVLAWAIGLLGTAVEQARVAHPDAIVVDHETVCADPESALREVAARAGLVWTDATTEAVRAANRPGTGWATERVAASVPGSWRRRLDPDAVREGRAVLQEFPWASGYEGIG